MSNEKISKPSFCLGKSLCNQMIDYFNGQKKVFLYLWADLQWSFFPGSRSSLYSRFKLLLHLILDNR